jgi:chondroitin 4-sulfotransferase 11
MIDHERQLIFMHLPKCGGTSIECALSGSGWHDPARRAEQHLTAGETRARYGAGVFDRYFKFAVVRNPWDLLVAYYTWGCSGLRGSWPWLLRWGRAWGHPFDRTRARLVRRPAFAEYLADVPGHNQRLGFSFSGADLTRQRDSLSIDGEIAVDAVLRFERLREDFDAVCERTGLGRIDLPHKLRSRRRRHYSAFYPPELRDRVGRDYADDVQAFGYRFERAAGSRWRRESP